MNVQTMTREQLEALVSKLQAQGQRKLTCKVTAPKADGKGSSGAIAVYGLGRFPVTLYASQWERLVEFVKEGGITDFIEANEALLSRKE